MSALPDQHRCQDHKSAFQLLSTISLYLFLWWLALTQSDPTLKETAVIAVILSLLNVRIFNIQHDCSHRSYFKKRGINDFVGSLLGVITLTPFYYWQTNHLAHHRTSGNLDKRGHGDVYLHTLQEFKELSGRQQAIYRLYRNPFTFLMIGPLYHFMWRMRMPRIAPQRSRERHSIYFVNATWIAIYAMALEHYRHPVFFATLHAVTAFIGGAIGLWLFFVQHQFEGAYWKRSFEWNSHDASLRGGSYLRLPRFAEWLFLHINLHHVHHLFPSVPNYHLADQQRQVSDSLSSTNQVSLLDSMRAFRFKLWDEDEKRMVGFPHRRRRSAS